MFLKKIRNYFSKRKYVFISLEEMDEYVNDQAYIPGKGNTVLIKSWGTSDDDHCYILPQPRESVHNMSEIKVCQCCGSDMFPIAEVSNQSGDVGLRTGLCKKCGYISRMRNNDEHWYDDHFTNRWLSNDHQREANVEIKHEPYTQLQRYIKDYKSVLDVGCGLGDRLLAFKSAGFDVAGCEPSARRSRIASETLNTQIVNSTAEEYFASLDSGKKYDVIIFFTVLAFVSNPFELLKAAASHLSDEGVIYIRDGNFTFHNFFQNTHQGVMRSFLSKSSILQFAKENSLYLFKSTDSPVEFYISKSKKFGVINYLNEVNFIDGIVDYFQKEFRCNSYRSCWLRLNYGPFQRKLIYHFPQAPENVNLFREGGISFPIRFVHFTDGSVPIMLK